MGPEQIDSLAQSVDGLMAVVKNGGIAAALLAGGIAVFLIIRETRGWFASKRREAAAKVIEDGERVGLYPTGALGSLRAEVARVDGHVKEASALVGQTKDIVVAHSAEDAKAHTRFGDALDRSHQVIVEPLENLTGAIKELSKTVREVSNLTIKNNTTTDRVAHDVATLLSREKH